MECPLCHKMIDHDSLDTELNPLKELYTSIRDKAMMRLKYLHLENAPEIVQPNGMYHNNPEGYSMKRFCYYLCFKCKKPYFGGERACNADQRVGDFNAEELVCGTCSDVGNKQQCVKHGNEYVEWKCRFCCKVACWFCWGTTHFCEECHRQASTIAKKPKNQLPACSCEIDHPPNGDEFCLGCSLCKLEKSTEF